MRAVWGDALDSFCAIYVAAEEIGSNVQTLGANQEDPLQDAVLALHARAVLLMVEIHGLMTLGYPHGAIGRSRTLDRARPSTKLWISVLQAEVHTRVGNETEAFGALDHADDCLTQIDPDDGPRPLLGHFDEASLMGERGITAVRLQQPADRAGVVKRALLPVHLDLHGVTS